MKALQYTISIDAPPARVWEIMLGPETYRKWSNVAWPGSTFDGDWSQGSRMKFYGDETGGEDAGGTVAVVTENRPHQRIALEHVAVLQPGGAEDTESDIAKGWIGTLESYTFKQQNGSTEVITDITTPEQWSSMFDESWPTGLKALKDLVESS